MSGYAFLDNCAAENRYNILKSQLITHLKNLSFNAYHYFTLLAVTTGGNVKKSNLCNIAHVTYFVNFKRLCTLEMNVTIN